jgi:hypothetical protein
LKRLRHPLSPGRFRLPGAKSGLALYGGKPVRKGPLPVMHPGGSAIGDEEIRAVESVLRSQSLYRFYGPKFRDNTGAFESALAGNGSPSGLQGPAHGPDPPYDEVDSTSERP